MVGSNFQYELSPDQGGIQLSNPYVLTLSIIFKLFRSQYAALLFNQIIWIFTSLKIYSSFCNKNKSMFFFILFFPPQLLFSNLYLKESLIASFLCLSFISIRNDSKIYSTLSFISLVSFYRFGYGMVLFFNLLIKKLVKIKITLNNFLKIIFFCNSYIFCFNTICT